MKENGIVIYRGASRIDGGDIVVIATGFKNKSKNVKTGEMIQVFILKDGADPITAFRAGLDRSICGDCPLRWANGGNCYVNIGQAPAMVYAAYKRGSYADLSRQPAEVIGRVFEGQAVRFGAYGDPVLIPARIVKAVTKAASMWTGYTHQWRKAWAQVYRAYFMASLDNVEEKAVAVRKGWRCFREGREAEPEPDEITCVNVTNSAVQCIACGLCDGARKGGQVKNICIPQH